MKLIRLSACLGLIAILMIAIVPTAHAEFSPTVQKYIKAYEENDGELRYGIVAMNPEGIIPEIDALLEIANSPDGDEEEKKTALFIAELLAGTYKDVTGKFEPIKKIKRIQFEQRLGPAVRSTADSDGVHIVQIPMHSEEKMNYFEPDNMIIKAGETVKWDNSDEIAHLFASFSIIGKGGLFTPSIEPDNTWQYTFTEPGEYYYVCFIHKGMVGKIMVEE